MPSSPPNNQGGDVFSSGSAVGQDTQVLEKPSQNPNQPQSSAPLRDFGNNMRQVTDIKQLGTPFALTQENVTALLEQFSSIIDTSNLDWTSRVDGDYSIKNKNGLVSLQSVSFPDDLPDLKLQDQYLYPSDLIRILTRLAWRIEHKYNSPTLIGYRGDQDGLLLINQNYRPENGFIDEMVLLRNTAEFQKVLANLFEDLYLAIPQLPKDAQVAANPELAEEDEAPPVADLAAPAVTTGLAGGVAGTKPTAPEAGGGEPSPAQLQTTSVEATTGDINSMARWISAPLIKELFELNQIDEAQYPLLAGEIRMEAANLIRNLSPEELEKLIDDKNLRFRVEMFERLRAKMWKSPVFQREYQLLAKNNHTKIIENFGQNLTEALAQDGQIDNPSLDLSTIKIDDLALDNLTIRLDTLVISGGENAASVIEAAIDQMSAEELATLLLPDTVITPSLAKFFDRQKHHVMEMLARYMVARNAKLANATQVGGKREKGTFDEESKQVKDNPGSVTKHLGALFSPTGMVAEHGAEAVADAMEGTGKKHKVRLIEYYQKFIPVWKNLDVEVQKQAVLLAYNGNSGMYEDYVGLNLNKENDGKVYLDIALFSISMPWHELIRKAIKQQRELTEGENRELALVARDDTKRIALVNAANLRSSFLLEFVRDLPADQLRAVKALLLIKDLTSLEQQLAGADESRRVAILTAFYKRLGLAGTLAASVQDKGVRSHIEERLRQLGDTADKSANQLLPAPTDGGASADRTVITTYLSQQTVEITIITEVEDPLIVDVYGGEGDQPGIDSYGGASVDDIASTADEAADLQQKSQPKGVRGRLSNLAKKSKAWQKGSALKQKALQKLGGALAKKGLGAAVGAASGPAGWVLTAAMLAKDAAQFLKNPQNRKKIGFLIAGLGGGLALLLNKLFGLLSQAATIGGALVGAGVGFAVGGPLGALIGASIGAGAGWLIGNGLGGSGAAAGSGALASNALSSPGTGVAAATPAALSPTAAGAGLIAASTAAGAGGAVATGGGLLALGTATLIPLLTILGMMAITVYTVFVILSSFLAPLPVGDPTARNTRSSEYVTVTKEASPKKLDNGQTVAVTYTVSIKPKPGYKIALSDLTDSANDGKFQILSNNPAHRHDPTFTPTGSLISISSFPPEPFGSSVSYTYNVTMAGGVDVLVRNNFEITYTVLDRAGQTVKSNQKLSTAASVIIGDPKVSCWPTSGGITQLPNGGWSHGGVNAYDIAAPLGSRVFAPVAGTAYRKESRSGLSYTGYGLYVEMEFTLANNLSGRLVFGHLSSVPANITGAGTAVNPGDVIGRVGSTGNSTGSHLHYELRDWPGHLSLRDFFPTLISDKPGLGAQVYTCF